MNFRPRRINRLTKSHLENQKNVELVVSKYTMIEARFSKLIEENKKNSAQIKIGFGLAVLRDEATYNRNRLTEHKTLLISDDIISGTYTAKQVQDLNGLIESYETSISARERELQVLFSNLRSREQPLEELQATYGDYRTLEFLEKYRDSVIESHERDLISIVIGSLGQRLVYGRRANDHNI